MSNIFKTRNVILTLGIVLVSLNFPSTVRGESSQQILMNYDINFYFSENNVYIGDSISIYYVLIANNNFEFVSNKEVIFAIDSYTYSGISESSYSEITFVVPDLIPGKYSVTALIDNNTLTSQELFIRGSDTSCQGCDTLNMNSTTVGLVDYNNLQLTNTFQHWLYFTNPTDFLTVDILFDSHRANIFADFVININYTTYEIYNSISFDTNMSLPYWLNTFDTYLVEITYNGNPFFSESSTQASFKIREQWDVKYTITNSSVNRNSNTEYVTLDFSNTYLTQLSYELYLNTTTDLELIENKSVTNTFTLVFLDFYPFTDLGIHKILIKFYRVNDQVNEIQIPIYIYDTLSTQITLPDDIGNNTILDFEIRTLASDTSLGVNTTVIILDGPTELYQNISSGVLRDSIDLSLFYTNFSTRLLTFIFQPLDGNIFGHQKQEFLGIRSSSTLLINNQLTTSQRLHEITLSASVYDPDNSLITYGIIEIEINTQKIGEMNLSLTNTFTYSIPFNFKLGDSTISFFYKENEMFFSSSNSQTVFIISQPSLYNIEINNTSTSNNEVSLLSGNLLDETNLGIVAFIDLIKIKNGVETTIDQTTADLLGYFEFSYVGDEEELGLFELKINFPGDGLYYLPVFHKISLFQNQEFSFSIEGHDSGQIANVSLTGDSFGDFSIYYAESLESQNWISIAEFSLDEAGYFDGQIILPDIFGPFILKIIDQNNNKSSYYNHFTYKIPSYEITFLNEPFTYTNTEIMINSTVRYRLLIDNTVIQNQNLVYKDNKTFVTQLKDYGEHKLKLEFIGDYLQFNEVIEYFYVYQTVNLDIFIPEEVTEGTIVSIDTSVKSSVDIPIPNATISVYKDSLLLTQGTSNDLGLTHLNTILTGNNYSYKFVVEENPDLFIKKQEFYLPTTILRNVEINFVNPTDVVYANIPALIKIQLSYVYNGTTENTNSLNPTLVLWHGEEIISEDLVETNNKGEFTIVLPDNLMPGLYFLEVSLDRNSSVVPTSKIFEFQVVDASSPEAISTSLGIVGLGVIGIVIVLVYKKKNGT